VVSNVGYYSLRSAGHYNSRLIHGDFLAPFVGVKLKMKASLNYIMSNKLNFGLKSSCFQELKSSKNGTQTWGLTKFTNEAQNLKDSTEHWTT
jgi:hypothetical protein